MATSTSKKFELFQDDNDNISWSMRKNVYISNTALDLILSYTETEYWNTFHESIKSLYHYIGMNILVISVKITLMSYLFH